MRGGETGWWSITSPLRAEPCHICYRVSKSKLSYIMIIFINEFDKLQQL